MGGLQTLIADNNSIDLKTQAVRRRGMCDTIMTRTAQPLKMFTYITQGLGGRILVRYTADHP